MSDVATRLPSGALVTGGARGIGRAAGHALARRGDRVTLVDVDAAAVQETAAELAEEGLDVRSRELDVTDVEAVGRVMAEIDAETPLGTVFNNAGIAWSTPLLEITHERYERLMAVNLHGPFFVLQAAARAMVPRGTGAIVNTVSTSGFTASTNPMVPYDVSKGGMRMLTVAAARELAPTGVRVNGVAPGTVLTDLTRGVLSDEAELERQAKELIPLGRLGRPDDIAAAVLWLSDPASSYVVGHVLVVDGGWLT